MSTTNVVIDGVQYRPFAPEVGFHSFHKLMRTYRHALGWTLAQAAEQIGCSKSYLHGMESGTNEPSLRMAYGVAQAYGIMLTRLAVSLDVEDEPALTESTK